MRRKFLRLGKDMLVYGLAGAVGPSIQLLLMPVYSRVFPPEVYGLIEVVVATVTVASLTLGMQLDQGLARHYYENPSMEDRRGLVSTGLYSLFVVGGMGAAALVAASGSLSQWLTGSTEYVGAFRAGFMAIPFELTLAYTLLLCRLERARGRYAALGLGWVACTMAAAVILVVILDVGVTGVFLAKLIGDAIFAAIGLVSVRRLLGWTFQRKAASAMTAYGLPMVPGVIGAWAQRFIDRFFILAFLPLVQLGWYGLAFQVSTLLLFLNKSFSLAWIPFSMELIGSERSEEIYARTLTYYVMAAVALGATLTLFAREVVAIVAPPAYAAASTLVGFLVVGWILRGMANITSIGVSISKRTYFRTTAFFLGAAANVALQFLLLPRLGLPGAAVAAMGGFAVTTGLVHRFSQRLHRVPYENGRLAAMGGVMAASFFVAAAINRIGPIDPGTVLLKGIAAFVVWLVIASIGIRPSELRTALRRARGRSASPLNRPSAT